MHKNMNNHLSAFDAWDKFSGLILTKLLDFRPIENSSEKFNV